MSRHHTFYIGPMLWWSLRSLLVTAAVFSSVSNDPAYSAWDAYDHVRNICIEDSPNFGTEIPLIEPQSQGPPISLGCKLRDCGPSASNPDPIDFRVRLAGETATESVQIEFSNLPEMSQLGIRIKKGHATIGIHEGMIRIPLDEEVIIEVPRTLVKDGTFVSTAPRINATLYLNRTFLLRTRTEAPTDPNQRQFWTSTLTIEQLKGAVIVNEFKSLYVLRWCQPIKQSVLGPITGILPEEDKTDQIALDGVPTDRTRLALVNGRTTSGCITNAPAHGTDTLELKQNMLSAASDCQSNEFIIFSPDRAMHIAKPTPDWTESAGEIRKVSLPATLSQLPIHFWILHKPDDLDLTGLKGKIENHLEVANELFGSSNYCGIEFMTTEESFHDVSEESKEKGLSGYQCNLSGPQARNSMDAFRSANWKQPGAINVYYVEAMGASAANHCGWGIFIGENARHDTLAHELGHELGLNEAQEERDREGHYLLSKDNLMWQRGVDRKVLTQGQCFRCNQRAIATTRNTEGEIGPPVLVPPPINLDELGPRQ